MNQLFAGFDCTPQETANAHPKKLFLDVASLILLATTLWLVVRLNKVWKKAAAFFFGLILFGGLVVGSFYLLPIC